MKLEHVMHVGKLLVVFGLYYLTASYGLLLDPVSGFATLFWLPSGISLAVLLLWGYSLWPAVTLGAFLSNIAAGAPVPVAAGIAMGNTLEVLIAAFLLKRFIKIHYTFDRLIDVLGLIVFAGLVGAFTGATIGVTSLLLGGIVTYPTYIETWLAWWIGDMVSNLLVSSFILVWSTRVPFFTKLSQIPEAIVWMGTVLLSALLVFQDVFTNEFLSAPRTYLIFPPLVWAALRFDQRWTVTGIIVICIIAVWNTMFGTGPFVGARLNESLLSVHVFMVVIAMTSMILAAVVSERKQLERRKDNFISIASHELKTPITSSKSYVQILKKRLQKEKSKSAQVSVELLSKTDAQLDKLTFLINDLLDVSKIQSGKFALRRKIFYVDTFVKANIDSFRQTITTHKVKREGLVKRKILGDEQRLSQVLINLLTNAVKYSPDADTIIVKTFADEKYVTIQVRDFGIGMSGEAQKKIFEPFYQVEGVKREGLGLGLHIASEIIRGHGGKIWVESATRKGSVFSIRLPFEQHKRFSERFS